jgi:FAD-dependent urate hydroxylase
MLLRSFPEATTIADPTGRLTIGAFETATGRVVGSPVALSDFIEYGEWFQSRAVPDVDDRQVRTLEGHASGFRLTLDDGENVDAQRVVVAAGIGYFAWVPPDFADFHRSLVSHSSEHSDFSAFGGRRVLVVGSGQSGLESAALLHEAGAEVKLLARAPKLQFLRGESLHDRSGPLRGLFYPAWGVGPPVLNWFMGAPSVYRALPSRLREPCARRAIRPAGAAWLRDRLSSVPIAVGRTAVGLEEQNGGLRVALDDGSEEIADHVLVATGYRVDIRRYPFLDSDLATRIDKAGEFPRLNRDYESSVEGLHFVGAPAAASFGPGMRFVSHTGVAAEAITRAITRRGSPVRS